ncbi:MAG: type III pantothenate kinase [Cyclobacteriaceae bacterium]
MSEKIEVLLVDLGSTAIKSAEVVNGEILNRKTWSTIGEVKKHYQDTAFIVSSVRKNLPELREIFYGDHDIVLSHETKLPIKLDYRTPESLGPDRIALSVGANHLFPKNDNLIVDLGTCVTMDIINKKGVFLGGSISPGLRMRMKAMSKFTDSLPDISDEWHTIEVGDQGKTTKESLLRGSFHGIVNEINGTIKTVSRDFASINIILTGGDANFFESRIKAHIFAGSKIVEIGLYRIWKYQ